MDRLCDSHTITYYLAGKMSQVQPLTWMNHENLKQKEKKEVTKKKDSRGLQSASIYIKAKTTQKDITQYLGQGSTN